jgi:hypothetical protein
MEDFQFSVDCLLSDEEAEKLFSEETETERESEEQEQDEKEESPEENAESQEEETEKVGKKEVNKETEDADPEDRGSSPNVFYSSIASTLKEVGIFSDLDDDTIKGITSPEDFGELFEKEVQARVDATTRRVSDALNNGVAPDTVSKYERTLQWLDSIEDAMSEEGEEADRLRKQILYNDFINKGFSEDRANREIKKSFDANTEKEDAADALVSLKKFYQDSYDKIQKDAKKQHDDMVKAQKKNADDFKKMMLDTDILLGETKLDKATRQKAFDAVTKPVWKDPDTGALLTQVQKFQKENGLEFLKQIGLWFVLTNEGKDISGFTKGAVKKEKYKALRDLETKINATSMNPDGSLRFATGEREGTDADDLLLSDNWSVGYGKN